MRQNKCLFTNNGFTLFILGSQNLSTMNVSLTIKVMVFILLALFASWPYFENFIKYGWAKRLWLGLSIIALIGLGIMDIIESDNTAKADKLEIKKSNDTIAKLTITVASQNQKLAKLSDKLDVMESKQDGIDEREDKRFSKLLDAVSLTSRQQTGDIAKSIKDSIAK